MIKIETVVDGTRVRMPLTRDEIQLVVDACGVIDVQQIDEGVAVIRGAPDGCAVGPFVWAVTRVLEVRQTRQRIAASGMPALIG